MKTSKASCLLLILLITFVSVSCHTHEDFLHCLSLHSPNSNSIVSTPNNASYASLLNLEIRNKRFARPSTPKPHFILTPFDESQIQSAVLCAKHNGFQIRVLSGGHDYEGPSYVSYQGIPYVIINLVNLRSTFVDVASKTAWVQAGSTIGEVYYNIANKSRTLAFSGGVCPNVGVGGLFSGGGYGMLSRKGGLSIDNIVDARLVDVNGRVLDRESMGEDLFWAIRGGGAASFGVIVSWKIKLISVPENVTVFTLKRTLEQNATVLIQKWQRVARDIDNDLLIRLFLNRVSGNNTSTSRIEASFVSLYAGGGVEKLLPLMERSFPELGLSREDCTEMSWIDSILHFYGFSGYPLEVLMNRTSFVPILSKAKSDFVTQPMSDEGLNVMYKMLSDESIRLPEIFLSPFGGKIDEVAEHETPFPNRNGTLFEIHYSVTWQTDDPETETRHVEWMRDLYRYMAPYVSKSPRLAYLNYRDLDLGANNVVGDTSYAQASVWGKKYYKNNFDRLVRVKNAVDPSNFFKNEQSIPSTNDEFSHKSYAQARLSGTKYYITSLISWFA